MWDKKNPWIADYISIPVKSAIVPSSAMLALGSTACFKSALVKEKGGNYVHQLTVH